MASRQWTHGGRCEAVPAVRRAAVRLLRDPEGRRGRRRDRRDCGGREATARRNRDLHDLRVLDRGRWNVVGQHVPRGRGGRPLQSLQLLVQAIRLDPHPRPPARIAGVPRRNGRRARAAAPSAAGRHRPVCHLGRRPPRLVGHARLRGRRRLPCAHQCGRLPQPPPVSRLARPGGIRGTEVPHGPLGAPARPVRQGRRRGRNGVDRDPGRAGHSAHGGESCTSSSGSPAG